MSSVQYVRGLLERRWATDVDGRVMRVPQPTFATETDNTEERLRYDDIAIVQDGGIQERTPRNVGYDSEDVVTLINIDLRTIDDNRPKPFNAIGSPGRVRMFGYRDKQTLEKETAGGLVNEVLRIAHEIRKGDAEYDLVTTPEVNDITNQTGPGHYRAVVTLRLREIDAPV